VKPHKYETAQVMNEGKGGPQPQWSHLDGGEGEVEALNRGRVQIVLVAPHHLLSPRTTSFKDMCESDTQSLCAFNTSPPRNRFTFL